MFTAAQFMIAKCWKQPKCPSINEWIKNLWYIYIMEYCFLRKLKMEMPFDPAIVLLGLYTKIPETPIQNNLCTPMFIAAQFTIAKCWKQPKCPSVDFG